jgi:hypothetical protein
MLRTVLFITVNAPGPDALRLDRELRAIKDQLAKGGAGRFWCIAQEEAVELVDLQRHLLQHQPALVHFSGHGNEHGEFVFRDQEVTTTASVDAIADLFRILQKKPSCVLFAACNSATQASQVAPHVDWPIGMNGSISDDAMIAFSTGFYTGVANDLPFDASFEFGRNHVHMRFPDERHVPQLLRSASDRRDEITISVDGANVEEMVRQPRTHEEVTDTVADRWFLVTPRLGRAGGRYPLRENIQVNIGRQPFGDGVHVLLPPDDMSASRRHATIETSDGTITLWNLSMNGTLVNGEEVRGKIRLLKGDTVQCGNTVLLIRSD